MISFSLGFKWFCILLVNPKFVIKKQKWRWAIEYSFLKGFTGRRNFHQKVVRLNTNISFQEWRVGIEMNCWNCCQSNIQPLVTGRLEWDIKIVSWDTNIFGPIFIKSVPIFCGFGGYFFVVRDYKPKVLLLLLYFGKKFEVFDWYI